MFHKVELMSARMGKLNLVDSPVEILSEFLSHLDQLYILLVRSSAVRILSCIRSPQQIVNRFVVIRFASNSMRLSHSPSSSYIASVALTRHCDAYELVGGLFAKALEEFGAARRLVASWLPSSVAGETRLIVDDLGVRIRDFALDPAQDLIVLFEHRPPTGPIASSTSSPDAAAGADIRVHLRRLSAGAVAPHPAASNSVLCRRAPSAVHG